MIISLGEAYTAGTLGHTGSNTMSHRYKFRLHRYLIATCFTLLLASEVQSATLFIKCPPKEELGRRSEPGTVTLIRPGWSHKSAWGRLNNAGVTTVDGKPTLSCFYGGGSGSEVALVQGHHTLTFPDSPSYSKDCTVEGNGFRCTSARGKETISCPESRINIGVISQITSPWQTAIVTGNQSGVEIRTIDGQPALACLYASHVPLRRNFPPGYDSCRAEGNGFRCTQPRMSDYGGKAVGGAGTKHAQSIESGGISRSVADAGGISVCTDLKLGNIRVTDISPASRGYNFTLRSKVKNISETNWRSNPGQQGVYVYKGGVEIRNIPFTDIRRGGEESIEFSFRNWRTDRSSLPDYLFRIAYAAGITDDGNNKNDDCNPANDERVISGADIKRKIEESGR